MSTTHREGTMPPKYKFHGGPLDGDDKVVTLRADGSYVIPCGLEKLPPATGILSDDEVAARAAPRKVYDVYQPSVTTPDLLIFAGQVLA